MNELMGIEVQVTGEKEQVKNLSQLEKLYIADQLLIALEDDLLPSQERYFGSEKFEAYPIKQVFDEHIIRKYTLAGSSDAEFGKSQKDRGNAYYEDLDGLDWFAYSDNFGTSEEKALVRTLKNLMDQLEEKWSDIYLLRNEKAVRIYNFEDGRAFEPDFLLFANDKYAGNISWQIFIEPKGGQFQDGEGGFAGSKEGWKQKFLEEISRRDQLRTLIEDKHFRIVGLPFYNEKLTSTEVQEKLLAYNTDLTYGEIEE